MNVARCVYELLIILILLIEGSVVKHLPANLNDVWREDFLFSLYGVMYLKKKHHMI